MVSFHNPSIFWCLFESFYIFRQSSIHRINWLLRYWDSSKSASQIESCFPSPPLIFLNFSLKHFLMIVLLEFIGTSIEGSMGTAWEDQEDLALQDSSRKLSFVIYFFNIFFFGVPHLATFIFVNFSLVCM